MHRKFIFLACFFIWGVGAAQQYSFVRFTIENDLSNNVVYATHQDSKGYMWIATHDGLNRYDGYEFKKFLHNPFDKKSLAGNMTIDIAEDAEGSLWILTNTHLHLYNSTDESFKRFVLPAGTIYHGNQSASQITNGNKRFLLLNLSNGLFVFDKINENFSPITVNTGTNEKTDLFNFPFFKDSDGNILIGAGAARGVLSFDPETVSFQRKLPVFYQRIKWQNEIVTSICRNKKNNLVYCTQEDNKSSLVSGAGKKRFLLSRSIGGLTVFIESMDEDEQGDIWRGYANRLLLPTGNTITQTKIK